MMPSLMRCLFCGLLQDEPRGVKVCARCGGELVFESPPPARSYVRAQMELDQITAPAGQIVDRYLVVTIETPAQVPDAETAPTGSGREPLSFVAVLDVSGSMRGPKIAAAQEAVRQAVHRLHDGDIFSLVTFSSKVEKLLGPAPVNRKLRAEIKRAIDAVKAGGQTALCGGLEVGIEAAQTQQQETNLVLVLSDGQANVGETDLEKVGARAFAARERGITTSTLGVGRDYNEALMVEIGLQGGGRFYHIQQAHQIAPFVAGELGEVSGLAARDAQLHLELPGGTGVEPFSAAYRIAGQSVVNLGDVPIDTTLEVVIRLLLPSQPADSRLPIEGTLTYLSPAGNQLTAPLNTVTLRLVAPEVYDRRKGAVAPVVERVLDHMQAHGVLRAIRTDAVQGIAQGDKERRLSVSKVQSYASLLGDDRAAEYAEKHQRTYSRMAAAPMNAKQAAFQAYARHRSVKDHGRDEQNKKKG